MAQKRKQAVQDKEPNRSDTKQLFCTAADPCPRPWVSYLTLGREWLSPKTPEKPRSGQVSQSVATGRASQGKCRPRTNAGKGLDEDFPRNGESTSVKKEADNIPIY